MLYGSPQSNDPDSVQAQIQKVLDLAKAHGWSPNDPKQKVHRPFHSKKKIKIKRARKLAKANRRRNRHK